MKKLIYLLLSALPIFAQYTISNPYQLPTPLNSPSVTVTTGAVSAVTFSATACVADETWVVLGTGATGTGAYGTITCSGGALSSPATITSGGTGYTQGQTILIPSLLKWYLMNNHYHIAPTGNPNAGQGSCMLACANYDFGTLTNKTSATLYTATDPGSAYNTVGGASCPAYDSQTYTIHAVTNASPAVLTISGSVGSHLANGMVVYLTGATGLTSINTTDLTDRPMEVFNFSQGADATFSLKSYTVTNGADVKSNVNGNGTYNADTATLSIAGCNSTFNGTATHQVLLVPGYEDVQTDSSTLMTQWSEAGHHFTAFNTSGAPLSANTTRSSAIKYALDNPATGDGSIITIAHPNQLYSSGWTPAQMASFMPLLSQYPGQIHLQVWDGQGYQADPAWDQFLSLCPNNNCWGDSSDDSYGIPASNVHKACTYINTTAQTVAALIPQLKAGRMFFGKCGSGITTMLRMGVSGNTIWAGTYTDQTAASSSTSKTFVWVGQGGRILKVTTGAAKDSYTLDGSEGRYVRLMAMSAMSGQGAQVYIVGNNIGNYYYATGLNAQIYSEPFWILNANGAGQAR